jgi:hypothetical protein
VSTSGWRYLGPAHGAITIFVVVATGNHWWLDGIVAVALLVVCAWSVYGVRTGWRALRVRWTTPAADDHASTCTQATVGA